MLKFTIFGERCSGTNFLEKAILENFELEMTNEYGWKHFWGYSDYSIIPDNVFLLSQLLEIHMIGLIHYIVKTSFTKKINYK